MEKLLKSFLSVLLLISCSNPAVLTSEDKIALAEEMWLEVGKKTWNPRFARKDELFKGNHPSKPQAL